MCLDFITPTKLLLCGLICALFVSLSHPSHSTDDLQYDGADEDLFIESTVENADKALSCHFTYDEKWVKPATTTSLICGKIKRENFSWTAFTSFIENGERGLSKSLHQINDFVCLAAEKLNPYLAHLGEELSILGMRLVVDLANAIRECYKSLQTFYFHPAELFAKLQEQVQQYRETEDPHPQGMELLLQTTRDEVISSIRSVLTDLGNHWSVFPAHVFFRWIEIQILIVEKTFRMVYFVVAPVQRSVALLGQRLWKGAKPGIRSFLISAGLEGPRLCQAGIVPWVKNLAQSPNEKSTERPHDSTSCSSDEIQELLEFDWVSGLTNAVVVNGQRIWAAVSSRWMHLPSGGLRAILDSARETKSLMEKGAISFRFWSTDFETLRLPLEFLSKRNQENSMKLSSSREPKRLQFSNVEHFCPLEAQKTLGLGSVSSMGALFLSGLKKNFLETVKSAMKNVQILGNKEKSSNFSSKWIHDASEEIYRQLSSVKDFVSVTKEEEKPKGWILLARVAKE